MPDLLPPRGKCCLHGLQILEDKHESADHDGDRQSLEVDKGRLFPVTRGAVRSGADIELGSHNREAWILALSQRFYRRQRLRTDHDEKLNCFGDTLHHRVH